MHFIVSTLGSAGDVFPFLGLSLELRRRGHRVTFATNAHFQNTVVAHGIEFFPLGTEEDYQSTIRNPALWEPRKAFPHVFRSLSPILKQQYDLIARFSGDREAVSLINCFGFGGLLAQEKLKVRAITVHLQPAVLWSRHQPPTIPGVFGPNWLRHLLYGLGEKLVIDPVVLPFLNPWRAELGLAPVKKITRWWNSPTGVVCLFPEWFAPPQPDWPTPLVQTDFPLWNDRSDEPLDPALEQFLEAGSPPIVMTPGSANVHAREFFAAGIEACQELKRRAILLTTHADQIPAMLPEGVRYERYVPLDLLLPRAAAFVHHGGIGSTSQALLAGIPQVLMPLAHDQFDNAERIRRLHVGSSLPATKFNADRLTVHLSWLVDDPAVRESCQQVRARLTPRDGLRRAADGVLRLVDAA